MPYPLVPPPLTDTGALLYPRTLQRWLDVNPVTKLTRTGTYITLPTFNINVNWLGYSDIVASFNFEGPNNFSLTSYNINQSSSLQNNNQQTGNLIGADTGGGLE
jgi:hypothetical protein